MLDEDTLKQSDQAFDRLMAGGASASRALESLYAIYSRPFHGHLKRKGVLASDAEDIVHEIFIAIWGLRGKPKQMTVGSHAYLWSICRNKHIDWLRKQSIMPPIDQLDDSLQSAPITEPERTFITMEQDDCEEAGFREFQLLEPDRAEVIRLATRQAKKLSIEEVAHYIGRSIHATSQFLSQSRFRYRDFIRKRCSEFISG